MGAELERDRFTDADRAAFGERLATELDLLRDWLDGPGARRPADLDVPAVTMGAEVEASFVDAGGRMAGVSAAVQRDLGDPRVVSELARHNIEANLGVRALGGPPGDPGETALADLEREVREVLAAVRASAAGHGARLVPAGTVPSVAAADVGPDAITDETRYHALERELARLRGRPISLRIDGPEPLAASAPSLAVVSASASWQLHLRVEPQALASAYDAAHLATVAALAVSGNSAYLWGHRLWEETRIPLFRQGIDPPSGAVPFSRVEFGPGWIDTDVHEVFAAAVQHHPPLVPVVGQLEPAEDVVPGGAPALAELRLQMGTVWSWVRPVYDPVDGGHVRLELRALPSGPSAADMVANAAFVLGLTLGLAATPGAVTALPFADVRRGFFAAAHSGLDADVAWPSPSGGWGVVSAREAVADALPIAQAGLDAAGVDRADSAPRLELVAQRLASGRTGAQWTAARCATHEQEHERVDALRRTTLDYATLSAEGGPVHTWPVA